MPGQESLDEPVIVLASAIDNSWSTVQLLLKSSRRSDPQFLTVERLNKWNWMPHLGYRTASGTDF
eukprot:2620654-Rhodomonas_salina.1